MNKGIPGMNMSHAFRAAVIVPAQEHTSPEPDFTQERPRIANPLSPWLVFRLVLCLLLQMALPAIAQDQDFTCSTNSGTITITGYTGTNKVANIPNTINGLTVTAIGDWAFKGNTILTDVHIPDSVTTIGSLAFNSCTSLTNINIPNSVVSINGMAFSYCSRLTTVTIGRGVATINDLMFDSCSNLSEITVDPLNAYYCSVDGIFFNKSQTTLIKYPARKTNSIYEIPYTVTAVYYEAFAGCTSLTNVTIPNSVVSIAGRAFSGCTNLVNINISSNVLGIARDAFAFCTGLNAITVEPLNTEFSSIDGVLFNRTQTLLLQYPALKTNGSYNIPAGVTTLAERAFYGCTTLTNIEIPASVTNIEAYTFYSCTRLAAINIPDSVSRVGKFAFYFCTNLSEVAIGRAVAMIGDNAFETCYKLSSVTIPDSVTSLGRNVFGSCTNLTNVIVGNGVTTIRSMSFQGCYRLASVVIGNSVTSIESDTFLFCRSLISITIPNRVTRINYTAFNFCFNLARINFRGDAPDLNSGLFTSGIQATVFYLPGTSGWDATYGGRPTALWQPMTQAGDADFGVRTNQFGFNVSWASGMTVIVDTTTNLANPTWMPLQTNTLAADNWYFSDPQWTNSPNRFYRLRMP